MEPKNWINSLFDMSFSAFITTRVIKVIFIIGMVFAGLGVLALIGGGFASGFMRGLLMLVLSPVIFLIYVLFVRIWCEMIIVVFRIANRE